MTTQQQSPEKTGANTQKAADKPVESQKEIGGRGGLEPVRYGDWEVGGKCVDF